MKKITLMLLSVVMAIGCVFGVAACSDNDDTSSAPTSEVTESEWFEILTSVTRCTVDFTYADETTQTFKMDGDYRSLESSMVNRVYSKEGGEYFEYFQYLFMNSSWIKQYMDEDMKSAYNNQAQLVSMFASDFASFTYSEGKYTCAFLDKKSYMSAYLTNIEITFEDGELVSIIYDADDEYKAATIVYTDIGSTTVTLPTDYIDNTAN